VAEHAKSKSHVAMYIYVFIALTLLTAIEMYIPSVKTLSSFAKGSSLVFLAGGKAFLVGYFYMHLNEERAWLKFIALIPLSAVIYTTVVVLESMYR